MLFCVLVQNSRGIGHCDPIFDALIRCVDRRRGMNTSRRDTRQTIPSDEQIGNGLLLRFVRDELRVSATSRMSDSLCIAHARETYERRRRRSMVSNDLEIGLVRWASCSASN